ncbi:hypothetical protein LPTSP4_19090 [Leptospira ryugenii]|uniref:Uncharacterized protein n=1 Tax=Leptospira ryugenii TaxID=1917863 RepID=A0A2P2E0G9_9LEPT|nr:hypothetical protein [Leptospira ryugenii]GBF50384.1 hypothetical protein LPTSP4_19090 [Leptospira ryugenii]
MKIQKSKLAELIDLVVLVASIVVIFAWAIGKPLFYETNGPVLSIFTGVSIFLIVALRFATRYLHMWPITGNIALLMIVGGGNLSSILMLLSAPQVHISTKSSLVMTSIFTSIGLLLFSVYEILLYLRRTPNRIFILDDLLIHLALVPGALSLIGHLFHNPRYLSMDMDPRVGISLMEMVFMALLATSTVLSNPHLFLWKFLSGGLANQITFTILFINQYIAPIVYLSILGPTWDVSPYGAELFILLGGVIATLGFLLFQSKQMQKSNA